MEQFEAIIQKDDAGRLTFFENPFNAKERFYWFEQSCHFPQWSESERFNKLLCDLLA